MTNPKHERWREDVYEPFVDLHPERQERFQTSSGLDLDATYPTEAPGPGEFPYTRGIYPSMYRGRLWTMRQYAGYSSPRETNERFRFLLERGQTGLSVAFDLPTQIGYDADQEKAFGEVGRVGVPISTIDDLDELLAEIPLDQVSISMTINATAPILMAFLFALARRRGVPSSKLRGTLQNDILKEFVARGTQRFPVAPSLRLAVDVIEYSTEHAPSFHPISISGYHIREAGATAVEELAFTLGDGIAYLDQCRERNLDLDRIGRRLSFFFNAHNHLFEEIAKFRAARRIWGNVTRDRFGITDPRGSQLRFHTQTAGSTLTAQEPDNNVVRVTVQALAAILGGTQSLHTNARDEALSLPTAEAAKLALRTQQVLAAESGVTDVADPLGGCPYVESLTDRIEAEALRLIDEIDQQGGMVPAIENGFVRRRIEASAYRAQKDIESGERRQIGVEQGGAIPDAPFRIAAAVEAERREKILAFRSRQDKARVKAMRDSLASCAKSGDNIMPALIDAVEAGMTLGEAAQTLAKELGEFQDVR